MTMIRRHSNPPGNAWNMTEEAIEKRDEILKEQLRGVSIGTTAQRTYSDEVAYGYKNTERLYIGHAVAGDKPATYQELKLSEFVEELEKNKLVEKVYVLSEDEDESILTIMIKMKTMSSMFSDSLILFNGQLTQLLMRAKVDGFRYLQVSFQYTEVFKNE